MPAVWREQSCTFWSLSLTAELSPAQSGWPHATTDLSTRIAANAPAVPCTCCTFWSWFWTVEPSPPQKTWPHVTTDPFAKIAANACSVASTCCTLRSWSWTAELSPPRSGSPHVTTDPSAKIAANAWAVARISGADLGLQNCHLRSLDSPKWSHCLHFAMQRPCVLLLPLVGVSNSSPACNNSVWNPGDVRLPALGTFVPWEFLGLKFEVPYFGCWKWKVFTPTTGKSYAELNHNMFWSTLRRGEKRSVFSSTKRLMLNPAISWLERLPKVQQEAGTVWHLNYFSWF